MNWIKRITLFLVVGCLLCGCTKSHIIKREGDDENSDMPQLSSEGILWEQVWEEFESQYADEAWYPFIDSVNGLIDPEKKQLDLYLLLKEEISPQEAADYATEAIKGFNDLIASQNSKYAYSSDSSYGGYVSLCNVYVMVGLEEYKEDKASWMIEDTIPAGEYRPVNPDALPTVETGEAGPEETGGDTGTEETATAE